MAASLTHPPTRSLTLTPMGWAAVRNRLFANVPDEFTAEPSPCPGTANYLCGILTRNAWCNFCTRTIDRGLVTKEVSDAG